MVDKAPDAFRTISEVADDLDLPQHVLRFWETRFAQIRPLKRGGGRRYYRPDDIDLLRGIKHLLYGEGYTIKGVQRILKGQGLRFVQQIGRDPAGPAPIAPGLLDGPDDDEAIDEGIDPAAFAEAIPEPEVAPHTPAPEPPPLVLEPPPAPVRPPARLATPPAVVSASEPAPIAPVTIAPPPEPAPAAARAPLSRDDTRKLQSALFDLIEAKKLLDAMR